MPLSPSRRSFLAGLFAAPAIIPAARLMRLAPQPALPDLALARARVTELIQRAIRPPLVLDAALYPHDGSTAIFKPGCVTYLQGTKTAIIEFDAVLARRHRELIEAIHGA